MAEISAAEKQVLPFFTKLRTAIEGDEMAALLAYLENYNPANFGMTWGDVRTAPETPERRLMGMHSMRAPMRRLLDVLRDGEVALTLEGVPEIFTADDNGDLKVPRAAFRAYIQSAGDSRKSEDSDVAGMFAKLFPGVVLKEGQGTVGDSRGIRWWEFPSDVLGDAVDKAVLGVASAT